jgi:hypothetical protein
MVALKSQVRQRFSVQSGEQPFYHPAPWLHDEADLIDRLVDDRRWRC